MKFKNNNIKEISKAIDLNNPVCRYEDNPILTPDDVNKVWKDPSLQVVTIHNAGIVEHNNETLMLFRSHLRSGISVLGIATSKDGITNWQIRSKPVMLPCTKNDLFNEGVNIDELIENEGGGVEDARITKIGDEYAITYSAYHAHIKNRVRVSLAVTKDFETFTRFGPVLNHDMRNVVLFPEKINNKYVGLFRPNDDTKGDVGGIYSEIKLGFTDNWKSNQWEIKDDSIIKTGGGPSAFSDKIGPSIPPIKTKYGWLNIFHGVRSTMDGNPYVLGVALHGLDDVNKVQVSNIPILFPSQADCKIGKTGYIHVPNVVFSCGATHKNDGTIVIYYGGCDTVMNVGITNEDVLVKLCTKYGQNPKTGEPLYNVVY